MEIGGGMPLLTMMLGLMKSLSDSSLRRSLVVSRGSEQRLARRSVKTLRPTAFASTASESRTVYERA
jgi:hypothetical protein